MEEWRSGKVWGATTKSAVWASSVGKLCRPAESAWSSGGCRLGNLALSDYAKRKKTKKRRILFTNVINL